jgi:ribokinase
MRIAIVGSYGVGMTMYAAGMPSAGETLRGTLFVQGPGGKGSNQAIAARRLGADVALCSIVGPDELGAGARRLWEDEGVDASAVVTGQAPTMVGFILVEPDGENRIVIAPGALDELAPAHVLAFAGELESADMVLTDLEIPLAASAEALRIAHAAGVATALTPAPAMAIPPDVLRLVSHLTPNRTEAAALTGLEANAGAEALLDGLRTLAPRTCIALTMGAEGVLVDDGRRRVAVPALAVADVVDTAGAGDAFAAAYATAVAGGADAVEAARHGALAGAFAVTRREVVPGLPTRADLDALAATLAS